MWSNRKIISLKRIQVPATIAIASILQESNNFSPVKTRYEDFSPVIGGAVLDRHRGRLTEMGGFIDVLSAAEHPHVFRKEGASNVPCHD